MQARESTVGDPSAMRRDRSSDRRRDRSSDRRRDRSSDRRRDRSSDRRGGKPADDERDERTEQSVPRDAENEDPDAAILGAVKGHRQGIAASIKLTEQVESNSQAFDGNFQHLKHQAELIEVQLTDQLLVVNTCWPIAARVRPALLSSSSLTIYNEWANDCELQLLEHRNGCNMRASRCFPTVLTAHCALQVQCSYICMPGY